MRRSDGDRMTQPPRQADLTLSVPLLRLAPKSFLSAASSCDAALLAVSKESAAARLTACTVADTCGHGHGHKYVFILLEQAPGLCRRPPAALFCRRMPASPTYAGCAAQPPNCTSGCHVLPSPSTRAVRACSAAVHAAYAYRSQSEGMMHMKQLQLLHAANSHQERRSAAREQPPALAVRALAQVHGHLMKRTLS